MCLVAPGIIKKIKGREAIVEYPGVTQNAMIGVEGLKEGDSVLVQMGIVIKIISKMEEKIIQQNWESLK